MQTRRMVDFLVYLAVRVVICVAQALRLETAVAVARWLAWLFCDVLRIRQQVVEENLARALPELSPDARRSLARRMWEHLFVLAIEVAHTPRKIHETNWRDYVRLEGQAELIRRMISGRPTLVVTGHVGNFEVGGYVLGILGFPTYTVARTLDNPFLDRFVNQFRGRTGQYIIPKNGGYEQILAVMGRSGVMAMLADQYAGPKGCWVEFFGQPASTHKAIALLALEHEASVCVSAALRQERPMRFLLTCRAIADPHRGGAECQGVRELTQWFTHRLEQIIRTVPDQYWWLHRRWKDTREKRVPRRKAA